MNRLFIFPYLALLLMLVVPIHAQQPSELDPNLKIAFVSNENQNEENIYVFPWSNPDAQVALTADAGRNWNPAWSPDGASLAFNSDRDGISKIYLMAESGARQRPLFAGTDAREFDPAWSPNGDEIAFVSDREDVGLDLYIADINGTDVRRITQTTLIKGDPTWSPDGQFIAYWERQRDGDIHIIRLEIETGAQQLISNAGPFNGAPAWSPDGETILFDTNRDGEYTWHLYAMGPNGSFPTNLTAGAPNSGRASWSPDNSLIAFTSDRDESDDIYIMTKEGGQVRQLTNDFDADHSPAWQPQIPESTQTSPPTPAPEQTDEDDAEQFFSISGSSAGGYTPQLLELEGALIEYGVKQWHEAQWTGDGYRIGVIDLGFRDLLALEERIGVEVTAAESVETDTNDKTLTDHGTNVIEIVHAVAPGSDLYACQYTSGANAFNEFEACVNFMRQNDVNIINHSVAIATFPFDGTSAWSQLANTTSSQDNIFWVNSAGNYNNSSLEDFFNDQDGDGLHEFRGGSETLEFDTLNAGDTYSGYMVLAWDPYPDNYNGAEPIDLNLYVRDPFAVMSDADIDDVSVGQIEVSTNEQRIPSLEELRDANLPDDILDQLDRLEGMSNAEQRVPGIFSNLDRTTRRAQVNAVEIINLEEVPPFFVQIERATSVDVPIPLYVFVEFLEVPNEANEDSVVAPGDAPEVLTVGAVPPRSEEPSQYSSFGVPANADIPKPEVSAPGEFVLPTGAQFFGTSAAAPFVAGIAALRWQEDPTLFSEDLRRLFIEDMASGPSSPRLGRGIVNMPTDVTPRLVIENPFIEAPEPQITFTYPPTEQVTETVCAGAIPTRLGIGAEVYVNYNLGLALRAEPSPDSTILVGGERLTQGVRLTVIDGPVCNASFNWWEVELEDESTGWVAEGSDYYLVAPVNLVRAELPNTDDYSVETCEFAPSTRMEIGERAEVVNPPVGYTMWRDEEYDNIIGVLERGSVVHVLGGPICSEDRNIMRWYVRILNGRWEQTEAWISEAVPGQRFILPE